MLFKPSSPSAPVIAHAVALPHENDRLQVEVEQLMTFSSFREMYENIPSEEFDAHGRTIDHMIERTYRFYTPEQEKKWGTVAIKIKPIEG